MSLKCSILEESPYTAGANPDGDEGGTGDDDTNKRAGKEATWGNLW